jgi:hypothetical protein
VSDPDWVIKQRARIEKARGPFDQIMPFLGLALRSGFTCGRADRLHGRVTQALSALREWRRANNQQERPDDEVTLAIRVTAAELATQLAETADGRTDLDSATIAWVLAGLRCPAAPFCEGCTACFTVTAPNRATPQFGLPLIT